MKNEEFQSLDSNNTLQSKLQNVEDCQKKQLPQILIPILKNVVMCVLRELSMLWVSDSGFQSDVSQMQSVLTNPSVVTEFSVKQEVMQRSHQRLVGRSGQGQHNQPHTKRSGYVSYTVQSQDTTDSHQPRESGTSTSPLEGPTRVQASCQHYRPS